MDEKIDKSMLYKSRFDKRSSWKHSFLLRLPLTNSWKAQKSIRITKQATLLTELMPFACQTLFNNS